MPIYSNQLVNRYQSGTDVQSTYVKTKNIYFMNNGLFFIKVVTVLIKTDMALILMNEFLRLGFFAIFILLYTKMVIQHEWKLIISHQ